MGKDTFYESTGLYGKSQVRIVSFPSGKVQKKYKNKYNDFGEGLTYYKGYIFQLTWKTRKVHMYNARSLKFIRTILLPKGFDYTDGWGFASSSDGR